MLVLLDQQDLLDLLVQPALQVHQVLKEQQVLQDRLALLVQQDQLGLKAQPEQQVQQDQLGLKVQLDQLVLQDQQDQLALQELKEQLDQIISRYQHQHEKSEERKIRHEARYMRIMAHIAD